MLSAEKSSRKLVRRVRPEKAHHFNTLLLFWHQPQKAKKDAKILHKTVGINLLDRCKYGGEQKTKICRLVKFLEFHAKSCKNRPRYKSKPVAGLFKMGRTNALMLWEYRSVLKCRLSAFGVSSGLCTFLVQNAVLGESYRFWSKNTGIAHYVSVQGKNQV